MNYVLYLLAVVGAATAIAGLYVAIVPGPEDLVPTEIVGEHAEFDPLGVISAQTTSPIARRNEIDLYVNGDEIFPPMLAAIREAEETIEFLTFVYWTGDIAREFAGPLAEAARRGVRVRVLLDAVGAAKMPNELTMIMEEAGCEIAWYHPLDWYTLQRVNNRTHRKVLVADRRMAFTGGVGIAEEWTGDAGDPDHWRDSHFRIRGPAVRHLHAAFTESWRRATGQVMADPIPEDSLDARGTALATPLATSPRGRSSDIGVVIWLLLARAERTVDIATPYFLPDPNIVEAIAATAVRGVRVRLLVPGPHMDKEVVRKASLATFDDLLEGGVEVWEYQPTMLHAKTMVVDGRWSMIGSTNFDSRSMELNDELVLVVDESDLGEELTRSFEADLQRSSRLTREDLRRLPIWERLYVRAALLLREQL
ncbi:MAG: phospholipase D-like domain-containing protein [Gemmatimonadota bacterium]